MSATESTIRVWDPVVRFGHWTLVIAFFTAYFTEDDFLTQHVWAGYWVGSVVCLRLLWGFVGSRHARFSDFVRSPATVWHYLRHLAAFRAKAYVGHNPAAGAMIVALLLGLTGTVYSGLMVYAIEEHQGPLAGWMAQNAATAERPLLLRSAHAGGEEAPGEAQHQDQGRGKFWEEFHEIFANLTLILVAFHVTGVLFSSYLDKENLIKAMITGRKRHHPRHKARD